MTKPKIYLITFILLQIVSVKIYAQGFFKKQPVATVASAPSSTPNSEGLTRETNDPGDEFYPKLSPDGKYLLYNSLTSSSTVNWNSFLTGTGSAIITNKSCRVIKKEIGTETSNPLGSDAAYPIWMPDGNGVIYSYVKPAKPVLVKTNINGFGLNYITNAALGNDDAEPIISKDGKLLYFSTVIGNSRMLCSVEMTGGNYTVLTEGSHPVLDPINSNTLIYNLRVDKKMQIFTINTKTGNKVQLTNGDYNNQDASFSKDGKWIVFVSNRENPLKNNHHVYMMKTDGSNLIQLTSGDTNEKDPICGLDGTVFFSCNAEKNYNIWKVKPRIQ